MLAVVAYWLYRARHKATGGIDPASLTDTQGATPLASDGAGTSLDPITLGPGEGVYDPRTGKIITNPDPYAPQPPTSPPAPVASPTPPPPPASGPAPGGINLPALIRSILSGKGGKGAKGRPPLRPGSIPALVHQLPVSAGILTGFAVPAVNRSPAPRPASSAHPGVDWGGRRWGAGDRGAFTSWLRAHGTTWNAWAKNHPDVARIIT